MELQGPGRGAVPGPGGVDGAVAERASFESTQARFRGSFFPPHFPPSYPPPTATVWCRDLEGRMELLQRGLQGILCSWRLGKVWCWWEGEDTPGAADPLVGYDWGKGCSDLLRDVGFSNLTFKTYPK
ncbi:unnamed protein product [Closterium sp. NIES-65]|nr:unnamed protein product [Closterium sp. NIES-65]